MRNALIAAAFLLASTPAWSADENILDRENGFRVTVPDGWEKVVPQMIGKIDLFLRSPRFDVSGGNCPLSSDAFAATKTMTQEQINKDFEDKFGAEFWKLAFSGLQGVTTEVDSANSEMRNGRRVFLAAMRMSGKVGGVDKTAHVTAGLHLTPGQIAMSSCSVWAEHAATEGGDIAKVMGSFEPVRIEVIAQTRPQVPATLALYAGARLDGPSHRLTQDVANLSQAGWNLPSGSFRLLGAGLWQVCDGINFTGRCATLAGAGRLGSPALRVGSARRLAASSDPRSTLGAVVEGFALHAEQASARFTPRR